MKKYFDKCKNLDELKKAYKAAAMKNHPDLGGDTETMKAINIEYEQRFNVLKAQQNQQAAADPESTVKATTENAADFIEIIEKLLALDGIEVELCGRWLWISGETMKHKEALKAAECRWSSSKKMWYWHHKEDGERWHRGKSSMSEIRNKYGSTKFEKGEKRMQLA